MVTFVQLRDVDPALWTASGSEWLDRSVRLDTEADAITTQVAGPLAGNWSDQAGQQAKQRIDGIVERVAVDAVECRAIGLICNGMGHALRIARAALLGAVASAGQMGMRVTDDGTVLPPDNPMARHDPEYAAWVAGARARIAALVDAALDSATRVDRRGHDLLDQVSRHGAVDKRRTAIDGDLTPASHGEIALIADTVPTGNADVVGAWWAALPPADRQLLTETVPTRLEFLDGIPRDVVAGLKGDGGYDRTGVVRWALDHWQDPEKYNGGDCTNFVSKALHGGGIRELHPDIAHREGWFADREGWLVDRSESRTWTSAERSYEFWSRNGDRVDRSDARPGDIVYWETVDPAHPDRPGEVHHAAVVTAVVDGDIRYTQHSGDAVDLSMDGRSQLAPDNWSDQRMYVIRPTPNW